MTSSKVTHGIIFDMLEPRRGDRRPKIGRLEEADERLTRRGNAVAKRTSMDPRRARVLSRGFGIVEDQLAASGEAADCTRSHRHGVFGEVRNSAQPSKEGTPGKIEPAFSKRGRQGRLLQIDGEELHRPWRRDPGTRELLTLPLLSCGMVDLKDVEPFLERVPVCECIETGSKNDQLTDAAVPYGLRKLGFGEFAASRDEEAKGTILGTVLGSLSKLLDGPAEDCDRQGIAEDPPPIDELMCGPVCSGAQGRAARFVVDAGSPN